MSLQTTSPTSPSFPPDAYSSAFNHHHLPSRRGRRVSLQANTKKCVSPTTGPSSPLSCPTSPTMSTSYQTNSSLAAHVALPLSVAWGKASTSPPLITSLTAAGHFGASSLSTASSPTISSASGRPRHASLITPASRPRLCLDLPSSTPVGHLPDIPLKSALKATTRSTPVTPNKSVTFHVNIQRVKLFLKRETPAAVRTTREYWQSDSDFDVSSDAESDAESTLTSAEDSSTESEDVVVSLVNFPPPTVGLFHSRPVKLENVSMAQDKSRLLGTIQVQNLAFQKCVTVRYTTDLWQTYDEVLAAYVDSTTTSNDPSYEVHRPTLITVDRFSFELPLAALSAKSPDQGTLAKNGARSRQSIFFCIRYRVAGQEYWDNNNNQNYHIQYRLCRSQTATATTNTANDESVPRPGYIRRRSSSDPTHLQKDYFFSPHQLELITQNQNQNPPCLDDDDLLYTKDTDDEKLSGDSSTVLAARWGAKSVGSFEPSSSVGCPASQVNTVTTALTPTKVPLHGKQSTTSELASESNILRMSNVTLATRYDFGASLSAAIGGGWSGVPVKAQPTTGFSPLSASATRSISQKYMNLGMMEPSAQPEEAKRKEMEAEVPRTKAAVSSLPPRVPASMPEKTMPLPLTHTAGHHHQKEIEEEKGEFGFHDLSSSSDEDPAADSDSDHYSFSGETQGIFFSQRSTTTGALAKLQDGTPSTPPIPIPGSYGGKEGKGGVPPPYRTTSDVLAGTSPRGHSPYYLTQPSFSEGKGTIPRGSASPYYQIPLAYAMDTPTGGRNEPLLSSNLGSKMAYNLFSVSPTFASVSPTAPCVIFS